MTRPELTAGAGASVQESVLDWYADHARDLPWRRPSCSPWGVLVSEVMLQQTPVARVEPIWHQWLQRWPSPATLAADTPGEAVRAWGRLGYPRRALRLHQAATVIVRRHEGHVPGTMAELLDLPGVGDYTAAAVAAFAFGQRAVVVDTNIRRVLARFVQGHALAAPTRTVAETSLAADLLPADPPTSARWNVAVMELGALVCTARAPACQVCPLADRCAWLAAGRPAYQGPARRGQAWEGTDRQVRGRIVQALRDHPGPLTRDAFTDAAPEATQVDRCLSSLIEDGLIEPAGPARFRLPR